VSRATKVVGWTALALVGAALAVETFAAYVAMAVIRSIEAAEK
jgi:hypothetical protein